MQKSRNNGATSPKTDPAPFSSIILLFPGSKSRQEEKAALYKEARDSWAMYTPWTPILGEKSPYRTGETPRYGHPRNGSRLQRDLLLFLEVSVV